MPFQKGQASREPSRREIGDQPSPAPSSSPLSSGQPATAGPSPPSRRDLGIAAAGANNRRSPGWYAARCLEEVEAAEGRLARPANADELVAQFMDCTSTDVNLAEEYMQNNGWDLEVALEQFWMVAHPESSDDELSELGSGDSGTWEKSAEEDNGESRGAKPTRGGKGRSARKAAKGKKRSFAAENPNVDRSAAVRGRQDESKLTITLMRDGELYVSTHGHPVDWSNASHIMRVNKWRQQIFRRNFGTVRGPAVAYLDEENRFLLSAYQSALRADGGKSRRPSLQWDALIDRFNARFAGRVIEGSDLPRPRRSKGSLQSQLPRIIKAAKLAGETARSKKPAGKGDDGPAPRPKRRDNDDGDDQDEHRPVQKL